MRRCSDCTGSCLQTCHAEEGTCACTFTISEDLRSSRYGRSKVECSEGFWDPIAGVAMTDASGSFCGLCNLQIKPGCAQQTAAASAQACNSDCAAHVISCTCSHCRLGLIDRKYHRPITRELESPWSHWREVGRTSPVHAVYRRGSESSRTLNLFCVSMLYTSSAPERSHGQTAPGACSPETW